MNYEPDPFETIAEATRVIGEISRLLNTYDFSDDVPTRKKLIADRVALTAKRRAVEELLKSGCRRELVGKTYELIFLCADIQAHLDYGYKIKEA